MAAFALPLAMAGVSAGMGALGTIFGHRPRSQTFNRFNPQGQNVLGNLMTQGMANTNWGDIENRARKMFSEQTIPSIAERFTAMGGSGGQGSSAFTGSLGQAGADLESQLASGRSQFGLQQLQMGLQPQIENVMMPNKPNALEGGLSSMSNFLPYMGMMMGQGQGQKKKQNMGMGQQQQFGTPDQYNFMGQWNPFQSGYQPMRGL